MDVYYSVYTHIVHKCTYTFVSILCRTQRYVFVRPSCVCVWYLCNLCGKAEGWLLNSDGKSNSLNFYPSPPTYLYVYNILYRGGVLTYSRTAQYGIGTYGPRYNAYSVHIYIYILQHGLSLCSVSGAGWSLLNLCRVYWLSERANRHRSGNVAEY